VSATREAVSIGNKYLEVEVYAKSCISSYSVYRLPSAVNRNDYLLSFMVSVDQECGSCWVKAVLAQDCSCWLQSDVWGCHL